MCAHGSDAPGLHHHDAVCTDDGGKAVRHHQDGRGAGQVTGQRLGFHDAWVTFTPDDGRFRVQVPGAVLRGSFVVEGVLVLTAVTVPLRSAR